MTRTLQIVLLLCITMTCLGGTAHAAAPWTITAGKTLAIDGGVTPDGKTPLSAQAPESITSPAECTFHFRLPAGAKVAFTALQNDPKAPILAASFARAAGNHLGIGVMSSGKPMATVAVSSRTWVTVSKVTGGVDYGWRFNQVRNLWDDRDRAEIGGDFARFTPFDEKTFVARLVVAPTSRQVWIDDLLVAEEKTATTGAVHFAMQVFPGAIVVDENAHASKEWGLFLPLCLDEYQSDGKAHAERPVEQVGNLKVPIRPLSPDAKDINLADSLWRYRLTQGTGPEAPYVNGTRAWPTPLQIDPASATFRVPYRDYQNAWLVAWIDEKPGTVPRGTFSFFRDQAGYVARTNFEVSSDAISKNLVTQIGKNEKGKQLYLIRVPLDTDGLARFTDLADQFLDFQVSKPSYLVRSYPDPIYYGYHPGGEPSSLHVVSVTLEESPIGFDVKPSQFGNVFEQPETPSYKIALTNHGSAAIEANVRLETRSYDGLEHTEVKAPKAVTIGAGETVDVPMTLALHTLGWHELRATVTAGGVTRTDTLSLMLLPPNTRTYGNAANETRFGAWPLMGHYVPLRPGAYAANEPVLAMLRKMGIRRVPFHPAYIDADTARKYDFIPNGGHTLMSVYHKLNEKDPAQLEKMKADEVNGLKPTLAKWPEPLYYYGGEWGFDPNFSHAPNPRYTGKGPYVPSEEAKAKLDRQITIFETVGRAIRKESPGTKLVLQWGSPLHEVAFMQAGFPKDLVDYFGMDAPMFELTPETPNAVGSINYLWTVRTEAQRMGWPRLPISWCEGPFLPAWEGALSESEQAQNHVRYWLLGLAYGVEVFEAGVVPFDTSNYYGAEHYGAGVFHGIPRVSPKPAAAALATATRMLCGNDVVGPVDTGVLTTYCLAFKNTKTGKMTYALWRVTGAVESQVSVTGDAPVMTDSMGNPHPLGIKDGKITLNLSPAPIWLTGVSDVKGFAFENPIYTQHPAAITRALPAFNAGNWSYSGAADVSYETNHFGVVRVTDPQLTASFANDKEASVTLAAQPAGDRPSAVRYGQLVLKTPALIPGKAVALGLKVKGNSGWGRVVFQVRDAKGELWTSIGTANEWNCDDTFGWSRISFEGTRYIRFPLPGNRPYDAARELETTWWKSEKGDGVVDLPLKLERIFVEASNETISLGQMKLIPDRSYVLSDLVAEYDSEASATDAVLAKYQYRSVPSWEGPPDNSLANLIQHATAPAPVIKAFEEPHHFNDGRRMLVRFDEAPNTKYSLYLARYADGRGAEKMAGNFTDNSLVNGLRPGIDVYMFLTATGADGKESKPSAGFKLRTEDHFAEK